MHLHPTCRTCGSTKINADATATWDPQARKWELGTVWSDGAWCNTCEEQCKIEWRNDAADLAEAAEGHTCTACHRPEFTCSTAPCASVLADREA